MNRVLGLQVTAGPGAEGGVLWEVPSVDLCARVDDERVDVLTAVTVVVCVPLVIFMLGVWWF